MNRHIQKYIDENPKSGYLRYHAPRYEKLLDLVNEYYKKNDRILDIGRSPFTSILHESLDTEIDTLGFDADGNTTTGFHYHFDLNESQYENKCRTDIPKYQLIIFSEVIEHLHTSPNLVLKFLKALISEDGIIIIQTPNAAVFHKRVQFLLGANPV